MALMKWGLNVHLMWLCCCQAASECENVSVGVRLWVCESVWPQLVFSVWLVLHCCMFRRCRCFQDTALVTSCHLYCFIGFKSTTTVEVRLVCRFHLQCVRLLVLYYYLLASLVWCQESSWCVSTVLNMMNKIWWHADSYCILQFRFLFFLHMLIINAMQTKVLHVLLHVVLICFVVIDVCCGVCVHTGKDNVAKSLKVKIFHVIIIRFVQTMVSWTKGSHWSLFWIQEAFWAV